MLKSLRCLLVSACLLAAAASAPFPTAQAAPATNPTIIVDNSSDAAVCSGSTTLRCAIIAANLTPFTNIRFAPGLPAVLLASPLPTITAQGTWIDGHDISNGCVCPRLDGSFGFSSLGNALTINASDVTISNLNIVSIPGDGDDIGIIGGKDIIIAFDNLGLLPTATQCPASASTVGVGVVGDRAGADAGSGSAVAYVYSNTISCHGGSGIEIVNSNFVDVGLQRDGATPGANHIGTSADGAHAAGNGLDGVRIASNSDSIKIRNNLIADNANGGVSMDGTNIDVSLNTLAGNDRGLEIDGGMTDRVIGNDVGTSADGLTAWPNRREGILINGGTGLFFSDNLIAYNGGTGLAVTGSATQALIEPNIIRDNGGLPIDLGNDGPSRNGLNLPPGPNNWLPYPVVTAASSNLIQGTTCPSCAVYVFRAIGNPGLPRGGGVLLTNTFANASGQWSATLPAGTSRAEVSLTAADAAGNSSEMSPRPQLMLPVIRQ